ncbi:MAG: alpha/beta fold hydrolase [Dehalococcoidia bacterium]
MPFASAEDGVRLNFEVEGSGPPLVMHHAFGGNLEDWREAGYVERLRERFRLILLDGRGHGRSDKPRDVEAYDFRTRVLDVVTVMREARVERGHLFGYSLGGTVGQSALIYAPQRFASMFLGGSSPYGGNDLVMKRLGFEKSWPFLSGLPMNDDREAMAAHFEAQMRFNGAVQALKSTSVPTVFYAGEKDRGPSRGVREFASKHALEHFFLEGHDHRSGMMDAAAVEAVVPRLIEFVERVEASA